MSSVWKEISWIGDRILAQQTDFNWTWVNFSLIDRTSRILNTAVQIWSVSFNKSLVSFDQSQVILTSHRPVMTCCLSKTINPGSPVLDQFYQSQVGFDQSKSFWVKTFDQNLDFKTRNPSSSFFITPGICTNCVKLRRNQTVSVFRFKSLRTSQKV